MKRLIFTLAALTILSVGAYAAVPTPQDLEGHSVPAIDFVGAQYCLIDVSTGTANVLCASGRSEVLGVTFSSVTAANFLVLRDSNTAAVSIATVAFVYPNGTGVNASGLSTTVYFKFPVPIQFTNGIVGQINSSLAGSSNVIIHYRKISGTQSPD